MERKLVREGRAWIKEAEHAGDADKLIPTAEPSPREELEDWVQYFAAKRARDLADDPSWRVEDASHRHRGWELTDDREPIPYHTHFIPRTRQRPHAKALEYGRQLARERQP